MISNRLLAHLAYRFLPRWNKGRQEIHRTDPVTSLRGGATCVVRGMVGGLAAATFMATPVAHAQSVNLVVNHNAIPETATGPAGGVFSYAPLVSLNSGAVASNVKLTQVLPEGVRLNSITFEPSLAGACAAPAMPFTTNSANKTIVCDLNNITQLGSANGIRALFNVAIPEVGTNWMAIASATATGANEDGSNQNLSRRITTTAAADLGIQLLGPSGPIKQFTPFNYSIKVNNYGPSSIPVGGAAVVQFIVPPNSTAGASSGAGWSCSPNGGPAGTTMVCAYPGPLGRGQAIPADLIIPVTPLATGQMDAAATVAGTDVGNIGFPDAVLSNNTAAVSVNVEPDNVVNVGVAKTASPSTIDQAIVNNVVTYTITPKRVSGSDVPSNVRIEDPLSGRITSYTFTTTAGWNCSASTSAKIDCSFVGTNPGVGGSYPPVVFQATVNGAGGGTVENTASIGASNESPNAVFDNQATAVVSVSNKVNLALTKAASKSPIKAGEAFNWTLTVRNQGPLPVRAGQQITVVDNVPAGIEITGFSNASGSSGWSCTPSAATGPATVICTNSLGLASNASSGIVLAAKGVFSGNNTFARITNTASITGVSGRDDFTALITNSASVNVSENQVDIGIVKTVSTPSTDSGDQVTYRLAVTNHDTVNPSTGIVVSDPLTNLVTSKLGCTLNASGVCQGDGPWPNGGFVSAAFTSGSGTCSANGNKDSTARTVTCNIPSLAAGATAVIEIKARHYALNANGSNSALSNPNTATVRSTEVENTNSANDSSTASLSVMPVTDLQVFKVPTPNPAAVGEPVTYTVHVYNAGPSHAANVSLRDRLPANAHWIASGFQPGSASCNTPAIADDAMGALLECSWADPLPPNGQYAVTYRLRSSPDAEASDKLSNTVDVATTTKEITTANNQANAEVTLKPAELDVVINMEHTDDALVLGEPTVYTITITNVGPSYATQVKMTDLFPSSLEIGGQRYPSSAVFSYDGITSLTTRVGSGTEQDLMASLASLCEQPGIGAETTTSLQLVCNFAKLAPNETVTIKFKMTATQLPQGQNTGTIFHDAKVELYETEFMNNGSDTAVNNFTSDRTSARRTEDTPIPEVADLGLTKEADSEVSKGSPALRAGEALVYTLAVTNHGPEGSTGSRVRDTLPAGLVYVASPGCEYVEETRLITCEVGPLAKDETKAFTIETTLAKPYGGGPLLVNEAEVLAEGDPNPGNNVGRTETKAFKPVEAIPTMGEWALMLLVLSLAGLGANRLRRGAGNQVR